MSVAANERVLKRRIDDYIWRDKSAPVASLRRLLSEHFLGFSRVAIIGGMVRDFARAGACGFKSDVDLVIDAPVKEIEELAHRLGAKPNRFGGYSYAAERWKLDFWALRSTWAYRAGYANINQLEDVIGCTFFDCDSVLYDVKQRQVVCHKSYLDRLRHRTIEINLLPTPSINGNLLRAVRRILLWDFEPGPRLRSYILEHLSDASFDEIARADKTLYPHSLISEFSSADTLRDHVGNRERRSRLATFYARQLALPNVLLWDQNERASAL